MTMRFLIAVILCVSLSFSGCIYNSKQNTNKVPDQKPNLLIIQTDEQSFRSISCFDNCWKEANTPNIDRIAKEGVRFENFWANHPVCTPSRAALLSGKYAYEVNSYLNNIPLQDSTVTIGHAFQSQGYTTGYGGKIHLLGKEKPGASSARNFGFVDNKYMFNRGHNKKIEELNGKLILSPYDVIGDEKSYMTDFLFDRATEFIEANQQTNWFYFISIPDPHDPHSEREPYNSMYKQEELEMPKTLELTEDEKPIWAKTQINKNKKETIVKNAKSKYLGMVKHIDDRLGELLSVLEKENVIDNTIIVFITDHGEMMGEFGRMNKSMPYDAAAKIPVIIRYPKAFKAGSVSERTLSNIDIFPTLCELANIDYSALSLRGKCFTNDLVGTDEECAFISLPGNISVITKKYKLVYSDVDQPWLFDRELDPEELKNFYGNSKYKDVIKGLTVKLQKHLVETNDPIYNDCFSEFANQVDWKYSKTNSYPNLIRFINENCN